MKCQILFSGKNKKNISVCCLLKILSSMLTVKVFCEDFLKESNSPEYLYVSR